MAKKSSIETKRFEAETGQLLDLMIRSVYSSKEIFLRELVSNASDAAEKLRFEGLTDEGLYENEPDLRIRVEVDKDAGTVTISDNGIGMSRQEVMDTIGSIASSGTRRFLENLTGDETKDSQLIGQFGVGFYSSFMVADKVTVLTRKAGMKGQQGIKWESAADGFYTIEDIDKEGKGTDIILHLKEDEKKYLEEWEIKGVISKYSDYIEHPVVMDVEREKDKVRKIIKKINLKIAQDPEMGPDLLEKIKSQGVKALDDSAMIMRLKYKTVPGGQFVIRREVYRMIQESFRENGIEFAHRNVTVYMPPGEETDQQDKKAIQAGAAAAVAAAQAEAAKETPK